MNVFNKFLLVGLGVLMALPTVAMAEDGEENTKPFSFYRAENASFYMGVPVEGETNFTNAGFDIGYFTTVLMGVEEVDSETSAFGLYGGAGYSLPIIDHLNDQFFFRIGVAAAFPDEEGDWPWLAYAYYKMGFEQTSFTKRPDEEVEGLRGIAVGVSTPSMIKYTLEYRLSEEEGADSLIFMVGI